MKRKLFNTSPPDRPEPPSRGLLFDRKPDIHIPWRSFAALLGAIILLVLVKDMFVLVQAGERAVVFSKVSGVKHYQLSEGIHVLWPVIYQPTIYDTKRLTYTMSGSANEADVTRGARDTLADGQVPDDALVALTSDGLPVTLDLSVRFHVDEENVWRLHQEIGPEFVDKVVRPQSRGVARMAFAQFPVVDVYSGRRQVVVEQIARELRPRLASAYIILDEVLLRDIRFSPEFQGAIQQKQVAQQEAQQMVFEVQQAQSEKLRKIIEAQGEASAIAKKAQALAAHPQLLQYEYVQRLPDNPNVVVMDGKAIINIGGAFGVPRANPAAGENPVAGANPNPRTPRPAPAADEGGAS